MSDEVAKEQVELSLKRMASGVFFASDEDLLLKLFTKEQLHAKLKQINPRDYFDGDGFI